MSIFQILAALMTLTALFSYINHRVFRLPTMIGVMLMALLVSLALVATKPLGLGLEKTAAGLLQRIDFDDTLMQGMLSFLLFAGALQVDLGALAGERWTVTTLSVAGVLISTMVFGTLIYAVLGGLGFELGYAWCLLFGALISPTDPVAVLGVLKNARVPKSLEIQIAGESLFNDGVGVVVFIALREVVVAGHSPSAGHLGLVFLTEALGGALVGLALGWIAYLLLKSVDNYQVEVLITLALVTGGYAFASAIHTSGPIAIVCAGILIGNQGRRYAMSERTRQHVDMFWELVDEILNALLFVMIGLEVLVLTFTRDLLLAGLVAIPALLLTRWISVSLPVVLMRGWHPFARGSIRIMTWGGLRGGISVALALSLPAGREREIILGLTYMLVVFSIVVQGLTLRPLVVRLTGAAKT
jgi:monovalent cation:H+ antiporter, CPA1 family